MLDDGCAFMRRKLLPFPENITSFFIPLGPGAILGDFNITCIGNVGSILGALLYNACRLVDPARD